MLLPGCKSFDFSGDKGLPSDRPPVSAFHGILDGTDGIAPGLLVWNVLHREAKDIPGPQFETRNSRREVQHAERTVPQVLEESVVDRLLAKLLESSALCRDRQPAARRIDWPARSIQHLECDLREHVSSRVVRDE